MKHYKIFTIFVFLILFSACSKDFLEITPKDRLTIDNFYTTDQQLYTASASLYNRPWFFFNEKFILCMEVYCGNAQGTYVDIAQFNSFAVLSGNQFSSEGYRSMFAAVTMANYILYIIENKIDPDNIDVTQEAKDIVTGEALFHRSLAYYYLIRTFGAVPILEENDIDQYGTDAPVYRNRVEDVYTLIERDLLLAAELLPTEWSETNKGRATKGAANGLLAEMYLTLGDYANARTYAEKVISSNLYGLMDNYGDIFHPSNNNCKESVFELQWAAPAQGSHWTYTNTHQAYLAASSALTGAGDGWGTFIPGLSFIAEYEPGDLRRHPSIMEVGDTYPELATATGGYSVLAPLTANSAGFRKYVVGSSNEWPSVSFMCTDLNTHILRYAEILLIRAEAILGNSASTTNGTALDDINAVRRRAGLPLLTEITKEDILHERRMELVLEGDYWYDLCRIDRQVASDMLADTERGTLVDNADPNGEVNSNKVVPQASDFLLPYPQVEIDLNPLLNEAPQAYDFNK